MSGTTTKIDVHHVTRVEGHGNIEVDIQNGTVAKVEWQVPEAPRFFEAMVVGQDCTALAPITSRICGICSIGHTMASLKASEAALGITISEQTHRLRELLLHGETLQSHILHVCYLVVPDLLKVGSVIPLATTHKEVVLLVTKLHRLANELCDCIGGRTTHPVRTRINGFSMLPKPQELETLKKRLVESVDDLKKLAGVVLSLAGGLPKFERETEYISLTDSHEYAFYDGDIKSSDVKEPIPVADYRRVTNEFMSPQSTAKWAKFNRGSYFAGALARFNNNYTQLPSLSMSVAKMLGLSGVSYNPYMNNVAQVIECVFAVERSIAHIDWMLEHGLKKEDSSFKVKEGQGVGAVEVPRGILFHDYTYDKKGKCVKANCIIPTNQNHANIQDDMVKLVAENKDRSKADLELMLEMLVRAYDPCISCSTHFLKVTFK
jgi:coenzyme F420-reducing hydrogenase alpha subunit